MKKERYKSIAAMVIIGLSGCGLKGPLYFPPTSPAEITHTDPSHVDKDQKNTSISQQNPSTTDMK